MADLVAIVECPTFVDIVTSLFAAASDKIGLRVAVAVEAFEANAVVSLFVIVGHAGGHPVASMSAVVAGLSDDALVTLVLLAVKAALGVDACFVVGAIVSVGDAFVQVGAFFPVAHISSPTRALECLKMKLR